MNMSRARGELSTVKSSSESSSAISLAEAGKLRWLGVVGVCWADESLELLFLAWSSLTTRSQNSEFCVFLLLPLPEVPGVVGCLAKGKRGKKLRLAARASVERISRICLKMAGQACRLMVIEEPVVLSMVSLPGVDFLWKGRFMVKTLVLEPNAPSMDMVSQEGCDETRWVVVVGGAVLLVLAEEPGVDWLVAVADDDAP